jgi:hypothetical protein
MFFFFFFFFFFLFFYFIFFFFFWKVGLGRKDVPDLVAQTALKDLNTTRLTVMVIRAAARQATDQRLHQPSHHTFDTVILYCAPSRDQFEKRSIAFRPESRIPFLRKITRPVTDTSQGSIILIQFHASVSSMRMKLLQWHAIAWTLDTYSLEVNI